MRFLVDMNLTPRWVPFLISAGHQAAHWATVGAANAPDTVIFDYARRNDFILVTNDLDFPRLLAYTRESGPSVVLLRGEPLTPEERGGSLSFALQTAADKLQEGAILTLDWSGRPRARLLPLGP